MIVNEIKVHFNMDYSVQVLSYGASVNPKGLGIFGE